MITGDKTSETTIQIGFTSSALKERFGSRKIKEIFPVPGHSIAEFSSYVSRNLLQLIEKRSKEIIEALDIYTLVVNKINSLDIASVERLLLQVIEKHLKWINLFGALLGALIGGIQIALRAAGI